MVGDGQGQYRITCKSPGSEIHTELAPLSSDLVLTKQRYSAFQNTNLESVLRQFQVRDVVISG